RSRASVSGPTKSRRRCPVLMMWVVVRCRVNGQAISQGPSPSPEIRGFEELSLQMPQKLRWSWLPVSRTMPRCWWGSSGKVLRGGESSWCDEGEGEDGWMFRFGKSQVVYVCTRRRNVEVASAPGNNVRP